MLELVFGNEFTFRRCQLSDAGVGHFYQGLNSIVLGVPTKPWAHGFSNLAIAPIAITTFLVGRNIGWIHNTPVLVAQRVIWRLRRTTNQKQRWYQHHNHIIWRP